MAVRFEFPVDISPYKVIFNKAELKAKINMSRNSDPQFQTIRYAIKVKNEGRYISVGCRKCKARLNYKKEGHKYVLGRHSTLHVHHPAKRRQRQTKLEGMLYQVRKDLTEGLHLKKQQLKQKYGRMADTYYMARRILNGVQKVHNFEELVEELSIRDYEFQFAPFEQNLSSYLRPEFLFVTSPKMREEYEKHGSCFYIHKSYKLFKEKPKLLEDEQIYEYNRNPLNTIKKEERQFILTTLCGLNGLRKVVIFGFAITLDEKCETNYQILKTFFEFQPAFKTKTMITNGGITIITALSRLSHEVPERFEHLIDPERFMKDLGLQGEKKRMAIQIIKAQTNQQYLQQIAELKSIANEYELKEIAKLEEKSRFLCFSQIPRTFVHGRYVSPCQRLNSRLNHMVQGYDRGRSNFVKLVKRLCIMFEQINSESVQPEKGKILFEEIPGFKFAKLCKQNLAKSVFKQILYQIGKSHQNHVTVSEEGNSPSFVVGKIGRDTKFNVISEDGKLKCNCGYKQKTLLPCDHLISAAFILEIEILELVHEYYKLRPDELDHAKPVKMQEEQDIQSESVPLQFNYS